MAYDRFEDRRGWREPAIPRENSDRFESRSFGWDRDDDRSDRGSRTGGDEVASWFGDDEAERRRREDMRHRSDEDSWRGRAASRATMISAAMTGRPGSATKYRGPIPAGSAATASVAAATTVRIAPVRTLERAAVARIHRQLHRLCVGPPRPALWRMAAAPDRRTRSRL